MSIIIPRFAPGIAGRAYGHGLRRVSGGPTGAPIPSSPIVFPTGWASFDRRVSPGTTGIVSHAYSSPLTTTPENLTTPVGRYPLVLAIGTPCTALDTITSGGGFSFGMHGESSRSYANTWSYSDGLDPNLCGYSRGGPSQTDPAQSGVLLWDTDFSGVGTTEARDYNWSTVNPGSIKWELTLDPKYHGALTTYACFYTQPVRWVGSQSATTNPVDHGLIFAWSNGNSNLAGVTGNNAQSGMTYGMACRPYNGGAVKQGAMSMPLINAGRHAMRIYDDKLWIQSGSTTDAYGIAVVNWPDNGANMTFEVVDGTIVSNSYNYYGRFLSEKTHMEILQAPTSPGEQIVSGLGFEPNMFVCMTGRAPLNVGQYYSIGTPAPIQWAVGMQLGANPCCAAGYIEESNGTVTSTAQASKSYATESAPIVLIDDSQVIAAATIPVVTDDGYVVDWSQVPGTEDVQVMIAAIRLE